MGRDVGGDVGVAVGLAEGSVESDMLGEPAEIPYSQKPNMISIKRKSMSIRFQKYISDHKNYQKREKYDGIQKYQISPFNNMQKNNDK